MFHAHLHIITIPVLWMCIKNVLRNSCLSPAFRILTVVELVKSSSYMFHNLTPYTDVLIDFKVVLAYICIIIFTLSCQMH